MFRECQDRVHHVADEAPQGDLVKSQCNTANTLTAHHLPSLHSPIIKYAKKIQKLFSTKQIEQCPSGLWEVKPPLFEARFFAVLQLRNSTSTTLHPKRPLTVKPTCYVGQEADGFVGNC